jgi:hypothetical protein
VNSTVREEERGKGGQGISGARHNHAATISRRTQNLAATVSRWVQNLAERESRKEKIAPLQNHAIPKISQDENRARILQESRNTQQKRTVRTRKKTVLNDSPIYMSSDPDLV